MINKYTYEQLKVGTMTTLCGFSGTGKTRQCASWAEGALAQQQPVIWIDGDQNGPLCPSSRASAESSRFWGFTPCGFDQAYQLVLAFCRLNHPGLVVIDSVDGLLPDRVERQRTLRQFLPRLIGAVYNSQSRLVCTSEPRSGDRSGALHIYSQTTLSLGAHHVD